MNSISKSINQFSCDLFNELRSSESDKNIVISPLSISGALSLVLLGSRQDTATQIEKVLHLPESQTTLKDERRRFGKLCGRKMKKEEVAEVHNQFHELLLQLKSQKSDSVLTIANAAFTQLNFPLLENYLKSAEELYQAKVETVDFQDDKARQEINSWVEEKTKGKIKDLFPENSLDKSASLILVNAVYFKGQWKKKFNEKNTRNAPFYVTKDSEISVPMMSQSERFNFGVIEEIDAQIIELPYVNGDLCMFIVLPNEVDGLQKITLPGIKDPLLRVQITKSTLQTLSQNRILEEFNSEVYRTIEEQITAESLMEWTLSINFTLTKLELQMPRFKIETSYNLVQPLTNMGMVDAFNQEMANLSGISDIGLYVSQVFHKCITEVNEEGTEAAAATGAVIVPKSLLPPRTFIVNHPFLSFIKHISTDTIIFHAKIYSP